MPQSAGDLAGAARYLPGRPAFRTRLCTGAATLALALAPLQAGATPFEGRQPTARPIAGASPTDGPLASGDLAPALVGAGLGPTEMADPGAAASFPSDSWRGGDGAVLLFALLGAAPGAELFPAADLALRAAAIMSSPRGVSQGPIGRYLAEEIALLASRAFAGLWTILFKLVETQLDRGHDEVVSAPAPASAPGAQPVMAAAGGAADGAATTAGQAPPTDTLVAAGAPWMPGLPASARAGWQYVAAQIQAAHDRGSGRGGGDDWGASAGPSSLSVGGQISRGGTQLAAAWGPSLGTTAPLPGGPPSPPPPPGWGGGGPPPAPGGGGGGGPPPPTLVPEPGTWALMLLGIGAAGFGLRRRRGAGAAAK